MRGAAGLIRHLRGVLSPGVPNLRLLREGWGPGTWGRGRRGRGGEAGQKGGEKADEGKSGDEGRGGGEGGCGELERQRESAPPGGLRRGRRRPGCRF